MNQKDYTSNKYYIFLAVMFFLLLSVLLILFLKNKWLYEDIVVKKINAKEDILLLFTTEKNGTVEQYLRENKIVYEKVKKGRDYDLIMRKLNLSEIDIEEPTIVIVKDGQTLATLAEIKSTKELKIFLSNYNIS